MYINFDYYSLMVWQGKGNKNRRVTLAKELVADLRLQIKQSKSYFQCDQRNPNYEGGWLPHALARKYPNAPYEFNWHYLFGAV